MTFKANIGRDQRVSYTLQGGNNNETGSSLETAKSSIQGSIDAISNLTPPNDGTLRGSIIVAGSGVYSENIIFPAFTNYQSIDSTNSVDAGDLYTLANDSSYECGISSILTVNGAAFALTDVFVVNLTCKEINCIGNASKGIDVSGVSSQIICNANEIRAVGIASIGVLYSSSGNESDIFNIDTVKLEGNNCFGIVHTPTSSTARMSVRSNSITHIAPATGTIAISMTDGIMFAQVNEINAQEALLITGGEMNIKCTSLTGDITVSNGAVLNCDIQNFTGEIDKTGGTINGRIGDQYYGDITKVNTQDILEDFNTKKISHLFPDGSPTINVTPTMAATEIIVPEPTIPLTIILPSITEPVATDRAVYHGWYIDVRNEGSNTITFIQNAVNPGVFSGQPINNGRAFTRVLFNGVDTYRIQNSPLEGSVLGGVQVPVPSGFKTGLVFEDNAYTWEELTSDGYNPVGALAIEGPYDANQGESIEMVLDTANGVINLPLASESTANILIKIIHSINTFNLTINSAMGENLQFITEDGTSLFDTSFVTSTNRPITLEPDGSRWRIFL